MISARDVCNEGYTEGVFSPYGQSCVGTCLVVSIRAAAKFLHFHFSLHHSDTACTEDVTSMAELYKAG
jgi:hypothetical protein